MASDEHDAVFERLTGNHGLLLNGKTGKLEVANCDLKMAWVAEVAEILTMGDCEQAACQRARFCKGLKLIWLSDVPE
jgi:hypothetical protein